MLDFAVALTLTPGEMNRDRVEALRATGWTDTGIHDIVQVTALFNYFNRLADGLGIDPEPEWPDPDQNIDVTQGTNHR